MTSKLSLSDWANVAEIFAAIGVIISFVFVGLELRDNTLATEAATREAINQRDLDFLKLGIDSEVLAVAVSKIQNQEDLSPLEISQLTHLQYVNFVSFEHTYRQFQLGAVTPDEWLRHENILRAQVEHSEHAREMWSRSRHTFTPEFQEIVDNLLPD